MNRSSYYPGMGENLIAKNAEAVNVDLSRTRLILIGVLNVLAAGWLGYALEAVVANGGLDGGNVVAVITGNIVFLSFFLLQFLFIKSMKLQAMLVFFETAGISVFFSQYWSWLVMLAMILLFVFLLNAIRHGRTEMENQMKVHFFRIEKNLLPPAITALALFISILYVDVNGVGKSFASKETIRTLLKPSEPLIQLLVSKDFSVDMTVSKLAESIAAKQFGEAFTSLPQAAKTLAVGEMTSQLREQAATYGIIFKNSDTVSDVFYSYFFRKFNTIPDQYRKFIPFLVFILTFFAVKSLGSLMRYAIALPAYALFQILLATGFVRIGLESRSREIILVG